MIDSLQPGTILHGKSYDYMIVKTLGQGAFGITYLASVKMTGALGSIDSKILVAVKEFFMRDFNGRNESSVTYSSKDGAFTYYKSKFIHEAENLSNLNDSRIIKVIELFEENQTAYYVMEYVSQGSLDNHIKSKGHLSSKDSVDYAIQIATALSYMHANNMLHLDLKPNNIMINGNNEIVLIDFGLAKRFDDYGRPDTSTTIGHGTPGYAPLEQANYEGKLGGEFPATMDIYALGATMYKMLTGQRPPEASTVLNEGFPFAELRNACVPESLVAIVAKCMEPLRKNRYSSAEEVIGTLNSIKGRKEIQESGPSLQGYYKKKHGEREYGTFYIENVPVTSAIDFPEFINIRLWDNCKCGKSYEVVMTDWVVITGDFRPYRPGGRVKIWDRGIPTDEHEFTHGIPMDVREFIITHGFLSTEHWEYECGTSPIGDDFGTDASITMVSKDGKRFVRRVAHAHPAYHNLLLNELKKLLTTTSLATELKSENTTLFQPELFTIPNDTSSNIDSKLSKLSTNPDEIKSNNRRATTQTAEEVIENTPSVFSKNDKTPRVDKNSDTKRRPFWVAVHLIVVGVMLSCFLCEHVYRGCLTPSSEGYPNTYFQTISQAISSGKTGGPVGSIIIFIIGLFFLFQITWNKKTRTFTSICGVILIGMASFLCDLFGGCNYDNMVWIIFAILSVASSWRISQCTPNTPK